MSGSRSKIAMESDPYLPGKHPECIHVAGFRDLGGRFSGFVGAQ